MWSPIYRVIKNPKTLWGGNPHRPLTNSRRFPPHSPNCRGPKHTHSPTNVDGCICCHFGTSLGLSIVAFATNFSHPPTPGGGRSFSATSLS